MVLDNIGDELNTLEILNTPAVIGGFDVFRISARQIGKWLGYGHSSIVRWRQSRKEIPPHIILCLCYVLRRVTNDFIKVWFNDDSEGMKPFKRYAKNMLLDRINFARRCIEEEIQEFALENKPDEISRAIKDANKYLLFDLEDGDKIIRGYEITTPITFDDNGMIDVGIDLLSKEGIKLLEEWKAFIQASNQSNEKTATNPEEMRAKFNALAAGAYAKANAHLDDSLPVFDPNTEDVNEEESE